MDYLVVRPTKQHAYAITDTLTLTDRVSDNELKRGAYVPLSDVLGLDEQLSRTTTFRAYLTNNLDIISEDNIPVLRYAAKEWRVWMPSQVIGQIRIARFGRELEQFMLSWCSLSDRQKIILEADEALYRLTDIVAQDAHTIKATTWKYLQQEEEAGRCSLNGWEKFRDLAASFLLRRLFPKFDQNEFSNPVILDDIRSVFNVVLLTRMLREQKNLVAKYEKDIATVEDIEALIDYYFPNPIKPR